jgi:putative PIN family toxin of toxin-antitoxin system
MLIVLDTSVIITAFTGTKSSYSAQVIQQFNTKKIQLASSLLVLKELKNTIAKDKIKQLPKLDLRNLARFVAVYQYNSIFFDTDNINLPIQSRDKNDNMFLELAIKSGADYLISLDKDLLTLKIIQNTPILTPIQFIELNNR